MTSTALSTEIVCCLFHLLLCHLAGLGDHWCNGVGSQKCGYLRISAYSKDGCNHPWHLLEVLTHIGESPTNSVLVAGGKRAPKSTLKQHRYDTIAVDQLLFANSNRFQRCESSGVFGSHREGGTTNKHNKITLWNSLRERVDKWSGPVPSGDVHIGIDTTILQVINHLNHSLLKSLLLRPHRPRVTHLTKYYSWLITRFFFFFKFVKLLFLWMFVTAFIK